MGINQNVLNCVIVEDDLISSNILGKFVSQKSFLQVRGVFDNITSAKEFLDENPVDLIFLDVEFPDGTGVDLMSSLGDDCPNVIITSAYTSYALEAFNYPVLGYLVKPISLDDFNRTIDKLLKITDIKPREEEILLFKTARSYLKIDMHTIQYIQALKDYLAVFTATGKFIVHSTMKDVEEKLDTSNFIRVSRSYIVSKKFIDKIKGNDIFIKDVIIHIGGTYKKEVQDELKELA
jgi:DNA-binding LytR/AlgR family response regulator